MKKFFRESAGPEEWEENITDAAIKTYDKTSFNDFKERAVRAQRMQNITKSFAMGLKSRMDEMAVTVNIYYTGENGNARRFAEEMVSSGTVAAIRAEDGNLRYEYFQPLDDQKTVLLIDSWRDQLAIDAHHASPMMGKIAELRQKYDLHMRVERYVSDEGAVPESDWGFIRK